MTQVDVRQAKIAGKDIIAVFIVGMAVGGILQEFRVQQAKTATVEARLGKWIDRVPEVVRTELELAQCRAGP